MTRRLSIAALVAIVVAAPALLAQNPPAPAPSKNPMLKLVQPWPDDEVIAAKKSEAEARKLFQDGPPLEFTLTADFKLLNKERTPNNKKKFPAVLTVDGKEILVTLGSRGHSRLNPGTCDFVPIKV